MGHSSLNSNRMRKNREGESKDSRAWSYKVKAAATSISPTSGLPHDASAIGVVGLATRAATDKRVRVGVRFHMLFVVEFAAATTSNAELKKGGKKLDRK
jgi:hypothetical protein